MNAVLVAVNGTLMRGLELNGNLVSIGATFVREDETDACYRLWSIDDRHPAMLRTPGERAGVALERFAVGVLVGRDADRRDGAQRLERDHVVRGDKAEPGRDHERRLASVIAARERA